MAAEPLVWRRSGRNRATALTVVAIWMLAGLSIVVIGANLWLMGCLALFTLPALWELCTNPKAGLDLDRQGVAWFTGKRRAALDWTELDHMRLDTRLDLSVRATAVLGTGQKIRLPYEATPPHLQLETALQAHGIATQRHHFTPLG